MTTSRLETFSDGVMAIIITIMVLELKVPHGSELANLRPLIPTFLAYLLSFTVIGIYWNNHHHMFHAVQKITSKIMWTNLLLLFCLSLIPFFTAWLGENYTASWPTALYAALLLTCGASYQLLTKAIIHSHKQKPLAINNTENDLKGKISLLSYLLALIASFYLPIISDILFAVVALVWFIPDRRLLNSGSG